MKVREIILEAAYDGMIVSLKKAFPESVSDIDAQVKWAKSSLKKADRVVWYLRILQATLVDMRDGTNTADALYGNYSERDLLNLQNNLLHYYGYNSPEIDNYQFNKKTVEQILSDFEQYENKWQQKQDSIKPVIPEEGDYELIKFPDGSAWWFVDRGYCSEEGRSGGHCGNVVGQQNTDERILSYRIGGHVALTFILQPNGYLGEMKAKNNQKPADKYHNVIMALLLSGTVTGIKGAGYLPEANFSIFDLSEKNLNVIAANKPSFISDQIVATPMDFLKSPSVVRSNPEYQSIAVEYMPAIAPLLKGNSNKEWEEAITMQPDIIVNAPSTLDYFRERVIERLTDYPRLILQSPRSISRDWELLKEVVRFKGEAIGFIVPTTPHYKELAFIAVQNSTVSLKYIPEEFRDYDICLAAVSKAGNAITLVPNELPRYYDICMAAVQQNGESLSQIPVPSDISMMPVYKKICLAAVEQDGSALYYVPGKLRDYNICLAAVQQEGSALRFVPSQQLFDKKTTQQYKNLYLAAIHENPSILQTVPPSSLDRDMCIEAVKVGIPGGSVLKLIPDKFKDYEVCLPAVQRYEWEIKYVPKPIIEYRDENDEYKSDINEKDFPDYKKLCIVAVKKKGNILDAIPGKLRDYDICLAAVKKDGNVLYYVPTEHRNYDMCVAAVRQNRSALHHVPDNLKNKVESELTSDLANKHSDNISDFLDKDNWFDNEEVSRIKELAERLIR